MPTLKPSKRNENHVPKEVRSPAVALSKYQLMGEKAWEDEEQKEMGWLERGFVLKGRKERKERERRERQRERIRASIRVVGVEGGTGGTRWSGEGGWL